ncbi:hypothetical protein [Microbacterium sp. gxy059]|uniref:hypothetical protein n=1 Tax=Microbacterium sp. gxy059 TaxID=2957199 RepID=UPI003D98E170
MGYAVYEDRAARDLGVDRWGGYGVPAICDQPECTTEIDRGLAYRCGDAGENGCGLSFCDLHMYIGGDGPQRCRRCCDEEQPFLPKPDVPEWERHMLTDESWAEWRAENPERVARMRAALESEDKR